MEQEKYSNFNEVEDRTLRAYNRAVTVFNIRQDEGEVPASNYFMQFDDEGKSDIVSMLVKIKYQAYNTPNTKDGLTKDLVLIENMPSEEYND